MKRENTLTRVPTNNMSNNGTGLVDEKKMEMLLADEESKTRELITDWLGDAYNIHIINTLEEIGDINYSLAIINHNFSKDSGLELVRYLRGKVWLLTFQHQRNETRFCQKFEKQ